MLQVVLHRARRFLATSVCAAVIVVSPGLAPYQAVANEIVSVRSGLIVPGRSSGRPSNHWRLSPGAAFQLRKLAIEVTREAASGLSRLNDTPVLPTSNGIGVSDGATAQRANGDPHVGTLGHVTQIGSVIAGDVEKLAHNPSDTAAADLGHHLAGVLQGVQGGSVLTADVIVGDTPAPGTHLLPTQMRAATGHVPTESSGINRRGILGQWLIRTTGNVSSLMGACAFPYVAMQHISMHQYAAMLAVSMLCAICINWINGVITQPRYLTGRNAMLVNYIPRFILGLSLPVFASFGIINFWTLLPVAIGNYWQFKVLEQNLLKRFSQQHYPTTQTCMEINYFALQIIFGGIVPVGQSVDHLAQMMPFWIQAIVNLFIVGVVWVMIPNTRKLSSLTPHTFAVHDRISNCLRYIWKFIGRYALQIGVVAGSMFVYQLAHFALPVVIAAFWVWRYSKVIRGLQPPGKSLIRRGLGEQFHKYWREIALLSLGIIAGNVWLTVAATIWWITRTDMFRELWREKQDKYPLLKILEQNKIKICLLGGAFAAFALTGSSWPAVVAIILSIAFTEKPHSQASFGPKQPQHRVGMSEGFRDIWSYTETRYALLYNVLISSIYYPLISFILPNISTSVDPARKAELQGELTAALFLGLLMSNVMQLQQNKFKWARITQWGTVALAALWSAVRLFPHNSLMTIMVAIFCAVAMRSSVLLDRSNWTRGLSLMLLSAIPIIWFSWGNISILFLSMLAIGLFLGPVRTGMIIHFQEHSEGRNAERSTGINGAMVSAAAALGFGIMEAIVKLHEYLAPHTSIFPSSLPWFGVLLVVSSWLFWKAPQAMPDLHSEASREK